MGIVIYSCADFIRPLTPSLSGPIHNACMCVCVSVGVDFEEHSLKVFSNVNISSVFSGCLLKITKFASYTVDQGFSNFSQLLLFPPWFIRECIDPLHWCSDSPVMLAKPVSFHLVYFFIRLSHLFHSPCNFVCRCWRVRQEHSGQTDEDYSW